jgi:Carboxypeptidase regulatory-like domain
MRASICTTTRATAPGAGRHGWTGFAILAAAGVVGLSTARAVSQEPTTRVIAGSVTDTSRHPVPYVNVQVGSKTRIVADDSGRFRLEAPRGGAVTLDIRRIGYRPAAVYLPAGGDTSIVVALTPAAQPLPKSVVAAATRARALELHGFYERMDDRKNGISAGWFFTPEDIERRRPNVITQMLDGIPSVYVKRGMRSRDNAILGNMFDMNGNRCRMTVYLDGIRVIAQTGPVYDTLDELVDATSVAGVEVYARPIEVPAQYQQLNGTCGVVLVWTK